MGHFDDYDAVFAHLNAIRDDNDLTPIFSIIEHDGHELYVPDMRNPARDVKWNALPEKFYIHKTSDDFWDGDCRTFSKLIDEKLTWFDLWKLAHDQVNAIRDFHHMFLEGIEPTGRKLNGIPVYRLIMGS